MEEVVGDVKHVVVFWNILKVPSEATPEGMFQTMLRSEKAWRG